MMQSSSVSLPSGLSPRYYICNSLNGLQSIARHGKPSTERHVPYVITQCYLPSSTGERSPALTLASLADTRFTYPGGMKG